MATFVLVHGGWGGGWEWTRVAAGLRSAGHEVHCPTLTGLGERAHLATTGTGLSTHVQDVVGLIETLDLHDVVLTGQSYGGMVVTGVVDRLPSRICRLVYLDAFVPQHGVSCSDLCGQTFAARLRELADEHGGGWLVPLPFSGTMGLPDDVAAWYVPRLVAQPLRTFEEAADLSGLGDDVPRSYVRFLDGEQDPQDDPVSASAALAHELGWCYQEQLAPHDLHVSDPDRMVALLQAVLEHGTACVRTGAGACAMA